MPFRGTKRFELIRKLGEGGEGLVYEAHDNERDMRVALKTLRELDATSLYRFKKEFRALTDVSHPNIVGLYDLVSERDDWFFTMELVEGVDFVSYVRPPGWRAPAATASERSTAAITKSVIVRGQQGYASGNGHASRVRAVEARVPLSTMVDETRLRSGLQQLAQALHALHGAGMVHRDLKPSNVRVTAKGRVVLVDFGIAAEASVLGDQPEGTISGTPAFMAPEQAASELPTAAADWYSFGVLLYLALTGQLPFAGTPELVLVAKQNEDAERPSALTEGVPEDLERLCIALLARRPADRPSGVEVLAQLGIVADDQTLTGGSESSRAAFVGRQHELATLHAAFAEVVAGATVSIFVRGVSGMGKSALVRRFLADLDGDARRPIVLKGRCHERESLPYKAFDDVIDRLSHLLLNLPAEEVHGLLPDDADLLPRLFPVLRRVPGIQRAQALSISDPHEMRERAFAALGALLAKLARRKPLVMYIDDLQWADRDSLQLLVELFRSHSPPVMLFVGALRAENLSGDEDGRLRAALEKLAARHHSRQISLGPLSPPEQRELVARLLQDGTAPADALGDDFWAQSSGSPLFLSEMARFAREHGALPAGERPSLENVIFRRIGELPPAAFSLVEMVAAAGEPMPLWILGDACGLPPDDRERALGILRVVNLVRVARYAGEPWLAPYHDRVRETMQARLPADRQRRLHRQLAEVLERWEQATVDALARHWLAAGDPKQAVQYLVKAARGAAEKLAFDRAAELYRVAIESGAVADGARRDLLRARGEALSLAGRGFEAAGEYRRAAEGAEADLATDLVRRAADELLRCGRLVEGMAAMREVMRAIGWHPPEGRGGILASLAWQRMRLGLRGLGYTERKPSEVPAQELARLDTLYSAASALGMIDNLLGAYVQTRHLRTALAVGEEKRVLRALAIDVVYRAAAGKPGKLDKAQNIARDIELKARRTDDQAIIAITKLAVGGTMFFGGDYRRTAFAFEEAEQMLAPLVGVEWERITARFFRCYSRIAMGDFAAAARDAEATLVDAERRNDLYARGLFGTSPGVWSCLIRDDAEGAAKRLASGREGWPDEPFLMVHFLELTSGAVVDIYRGDAKAAVERLEAGLPRFRSSVLSKMPWVMAEFRRYYVGALTMVGNVRLARKWLVPLRMLDTPLTRAYLAAYEGIFAVRAGKREAGQRRLIDAIHLFGVADTVQLATATKFQLGRVMGGAEGERMMADALAWMKDAGVKEPARMIDLLLPPV